MASYDEVIPPGQAGKVTAQLKTENYRGTVEKLITVTTNDPANASLTLRLKATIVGSVEVLPRPGAAFPSGMGWDYSGTLIVRKDPTESGDLQVQELATSVPWLVAKARKVESTIPAAGGMPEARPGDYLLEISVAEDAPRTAGGFQITFKTGLAREPSVTVPVSVVLQTPMRIMPSPLYLPPPDAGKGTQGILSAMLRPGLGKEKLTAEASPASFRVSLEPDGTRKYRALVTWLPAGENPPTEGNIVFRVGEESQTVLVRVGPATRPVPGIRPPRLTPATKLPAETGTP